MKRSVWVGLILLGIAGTGMTAWLAYRIASFGRGERAAAILASQPASQPAAMPAVMPAAMLAPMPINNWYVCADLGIGPVPGLPDPRQRFKVCHDSGWEVYTYCIEPNIPAPTLGTICSLINDQTFFCGAGVQSLTEYRILQTPAASTGTPSVTPSPTATNTATPTPTNTATLTPTNTPTLTPTPLNSATPLAARTPRPHPGGQGNLLRFLRRRVMHQAVFPQLLLILLVLV